MAENPIISPSSFFVKTLGSSGGITTDFRRTYLFKVALPALIRGGGTAPVNQVELITYFIASTVSPIETTGSIPVDWMNSQIKLAGRTTYSEWTVNVRDDANSKAFDYFKAWKQIVYSAQNGQSNLPSNYKYDFDLFLLNNLGVATRSYTIKGGWVSLIGQVAFDYTTETIVNFPITLQYDDFIVKTI